MAELWVITIGFIVSLGLVGGVFIYFLRSALNKEDSVKVDRLPERDDQFGKKD